LLNDAPGDVPRAEPSQERALILFFVDEHPAASWPELLAGQEAGLEQAGVGRVSWASPFVATVPGTDTYADRLWPEGG
jgi:hypothetical protein